MLKNACRNWRLSPSQQQLAALYWRLSLHLAHSYERRWSLEWDEAYDAAVSALMTTARVYETSQYERYDRFKDLLFKFTRFKMCRTLRKKLGRRLQVAWTDLAPFHTPFSTKAEVCGLREQDCADRKFPTAEKSAELRDICDFLQRQLSPECWRVLWGFLAEGKLMKEMEIPNVLSHTRIGKVFKKALAQACATLGISETTKRIVTEQDILRVLSSAQCRLTMPQINRELSRRGIKVSPHGYTTVQRLLSLKKKGLIDYSRLTKPQGYGLITTP